MPNGYCNPVAKREVATGRPMPSAVRKTRIRPPPLSARKMSPLGAVCRVRGSSKPVAKTPASNPGGTCGLAPDGGSMTEGVRDDDRLANGAGRASAVIFRITPGASPRQSPNPAAPTRTASARIASARTASARTGPAATAHRAMSRAPAKALMRLDVHLPPGLPSWVAAGGCRASPQARKIFFQATVPEAVSVWSRFALPAQRNFALYAPRVTLRRRNITMTTGHKPLVFDRPLRGRIYDSIAETIGNTPMVRIPHIVAEEGITADICLKLEFFNPISSVKDRIGVNMILALEASGKLKPGGTIIEPTSGNTGIGLAFVAASRGYRLILTMPESVSIERRKMLAYLGAQLDLTPREKGMNGAIAKANELLEAHPGAIMANQFGNPANPAIHVK